VVGTSGPELKLCWKWWEHST